MRVRKRKRAGADADVMMSPLIDCVFLLLIFFLVTSILKRWERQIPITLADPTASVAVEIRAEAVLLGIDAAGKLHRHVDRDHLGIARFQPAASPVALIDEVLAIHGPDAPIELIVEEDTPFQVVIDTIDTLQHAGLTRVRSRVRDGEL